MRSIAFGYVVGPNYNASVMNEAVMTSLCAANSRDCTYFVPDYVAATAWFAHAVPTSARVTTYVSNRSCTPVSSLCIPGTFIRCAGFDVTDPLVAMESYDLPAAILAQICTNVGCDLFVSQNDGSGGTLYKMTRFAAAASLLRTMPLPPPPPPPGTLLWKFEAAARIFNPRPLTVDTTDIRRCATQHEDCTCTGTAYYGRDGIDFHTMLSGPHASLPSKRAIKCEDAGGPFSDPDPGQPKQCYCVSKGSAATIYASSCDASILWALKADGSTRFVKDFQAQGAVGLSSPVVDEVGDIYIGSQQGLVYAIHKDGTAKWTFQTNSGSYHAVALGPLGRLYVGTAAHLVALDRSHGTLAWQYAMTQGINSSPTVSADGTVYVGSQDGSLYAILHNVCHHKLSPHSVTCPPNSGPSPALSAHDRGRCRGSILQSQTPYEAHFSGHRGRCNGNMRRLPPCGGPIPPWEATAPYISGPIATTTRRTLSMAMAPSSGRF